MTDSDFRHRRQQLLDRFLSGEIDQSSYDRMLGQLEQIESDSKAEPPKTDTSSSNTQERTAHMSIGDHDTVAPAASALQPGVEVGGYRLIQQLGRGGMGEVWKARDTVGERDVVVKVLPPELQNSQDEMDRVRDVFHRVHALQHQHICPIYQLGQDPRVGYYLVMKFVEGVTLSRYRRDYLTSHDAFPLAEALRVLAPTAAALDYAHSQKVVHRDVKPHNIMISPRGDDPQLVDFGLAAEIRMSVTRISRVEMETSGTYPYMAPEQWKGEYQDGRTDQYALGVVAYELISGQTPFHTPDALVLRQCVLSEQVPEIPGQPAHVIAALRKCMAKTRGDRFESCSAFIEALREQATRPIRPPRPSAIGSGQMKSDIALELKEATAALRQTGDLRSFLEREAATRMPHWRQAARQGLAGGQWLLGKCFEHGIVVDKSMPEAIDLYRQAARRGEPVAQVTLGNCFLRGRGVPQNSAQAVVWFRKAARKGDAFAATALGRCYLHGEGVAVNPKEALKYLNKAAQQGHPPAQVELGVCYAEGFHVPRDENQARTWLRLAAEQGNQKAQQWLSHLDSRKSNTAASPQATKLVADTGAEDLPHAASPQAALTDVESELTRKEDIFPSAGSPATVANTAPGSYGGPGTVDYDSSPSWRSDSQVAVPTRNWLVPAIVAGVVAILLTMFAVGGVYTVVQLLKPDDPSGDGPVDPAGGSDDNPQGVIGRTAEDPTQGDDEVGGDEVGGDEVGGDEVGGDDVGGDEVGGDEVGGDEVGGDEVGGDEVGGDDVGGGDEVGGDEVDGPGDQGDVDSTDVVEDNGSLDPFFFPGGPDALPEPMYVALDFVRDDTQLAAGNSTGLSLWDAETGEFIEELGQMPGGVVDVDTSWNTFWIGMAGRDDPAGGELARAIWFYNVYDPNNEEEAASETQVIDEVKYAGHHAQTLCLNLSQDTLKILSGDSEGNVIFWDGYEAAQLASMSAPNTRVLAAELAWADFLGVTAHDDATIRVWDLYEKKEVRRFTGHEGPVYDIAIDRDRDVCISAGADGTLKIWNFRPSNTSWFNYEGEDLIRTLEGHSAPVTGVVVSVDGDYAFSSSLDGTVRAWDLSSGRQLAVYQADSQLSDIALSYNADRVAASGDKIYVWELPAQFHRGR